jgi:hypothetical protein
MSEKPKPECINCRFYGTNPGTGTSDYYCRRHAPVLVQALMQDHGMEMGATKFPKTHGWYWCGDHEPVAHGQDR